MKGFFVLTLLSLLISACAVTSTESLAPEFNISTPNAGDSVMVDVSPQMTIFNVTSERGIGQADVSLIAGQFPQPAALCLHLSGLESLRFAYDDTIITLAVSSTTPNQVLQRVIAENGAETPITPDSPYWMATEINSANSTIPLREGCFQIAFPPDFYQVGADAFSIEWIDFYR